MGLRSRVLSLAGMLVLTFATLGVGGLSGCNPFSLVDKPSGDAQLLSAARASFDQGDFAGASNYYSQLSSASADQAASETAFLMLAQNGATSAVFMNAVLSGASSGGTLVTKVAESLSQNGNATPTARLAFFHAYQKQTTIVDTHVKGLVQFITSLALLGELLAESASVPGTLKQGDLVKNPSLCALSTVVSPAAGCGAPGTLLLTGAASIGTLLTATDAQLTGAANLYMVNSAIVALDQGINNMQTTGSLGSSTSSFTQNLINNGSILLVANTDSPGYRLLLIQQSVGE